MKVLFVCLGNICRSPLAEGIMKDKLQNLNPQAIVDSCGTSDYHVGDKPDIRTRRNAEKNGILLNHLGRQLSVGDLEAYDYIFAMDRSNYRNILQLKNGSQYAFKIKLLREFDPIAGDEVPDPYYGNEDGFQEVFDILDRSIAGFIADLQSKGLL